MRLLNLPEDCLGSTTILFSVQRVHAARGSFRVRLLSLV